MLKVFGLLLRVYAYVFHLTLSAFLIGTAGIALSRHEPWFEVRSTAFLGLMELACTLLGFTRWLRFLFVLCAGLVLRAAFMGYFSQPYMPAWLPSGATVAFIGALLVLFKPERNGMPV